MCSSNKATLPLVCLTVPSEVPHCVLTNWEDCNSHQHTQSPSHGDVTHGSWANAEELFLMVMVGVGFGYLDSKKVTPKEA